MVLRYRRYTEIEHGTTRPFAELVITIPRNSLLDRDETSLENLSGRKLRRQHRTYDFYLDRHNLPRLVIRSLLSLISSSFLFYRSIIRVIRSSTNR